MTHPFFEGLDFTKIRSKISPLSKLPRAHCVAKSSFPSKSWRVHNQAKSTFGETPMRHGLLEVEEESEMLAEPEPSDSSCRQPCFGAPATEERKSLLRSRSSICANDDRRPSDGNDVVILSGILKKKGIIFHNNRLVNLSKSGILTYYDPKNTTLPRATILLTDP